MAAGLPRQDHVYRTTDESFRFHNKSFDEMSCKLDSTENRAILNTTLRNKIPRQKRVQFGLEDEGVQQRNKKWGGKKRGKPPKKKTTIVICFTHLLGIRLGLP